MTRRVRPRLAAAVITLTLGVAASGPARASGIDSARALLAAGDYQQAKAAFSRLMRGPARKAAALGLARAQLETGRLGAAQLNARAGAQGKLRTRGQTLLGEIQLRAGKVAAAEATLRRVVARRKRALRARILLGLAYRQQGKASAAKQVFDFFYDEYDADRIDKRDPAQLTYLAMACRYTDNFRDAADMAREALKVAPKHVEALLQLAEMSLEKYEAGHAEAHYRRLLKINPRHADALVGLAEVVLEQSNHVQKAMALVKRAEAVHPRHMGARVVRAQVLIDAEEYRKAEAVLREALKTNRRHLGALSMLAASVWLRDDRAGFERVRDKVLKLNPRHTALFRTVVKMGVRKHRYAEAIELSKQAIKIDPQDWYSLAQLGTNYLRLGDDANGLKYLKQAWSGDRFNVRNYNLLNLFEEDVAKSYTFVRSKHFRVRAHRDEAKLLERVVVPELERAFRTYERKYGFTPRLPVTVELFRDPQHYAVRTVGLPGLHALGVCFGRVITSTSPLAGRFNWGQVLWHELNHVFTIQMSRSRIPRWFTEGLADMEPLLRRPEWRREHDFDIYRAIRAGRLKGLASMRTAFSRARNIQDMVVAYYQGSLMAMYLVKHWGLARTLTAVRAYAKGKRTAQILPAITGISLSELDQRFKAAQLKRLSRYRGNWYVDPRSYSDLDGWRARARARPADSSAQTGLALALMFHRKLKQARQAARAVLKAQPRNREALYVLAKSSIAMRDVRQGESYLRKLLAAGGDGYEVREALGRLAIRRKDLAAAARHLNRAKQLDPERGAPYAALAVAYKHAGKIDQQIAELKGLVRIDQQSYRPLAALNRLLAGRKDYVALRRFGKMAYYISPGTARVHLHLADALAAPAPRPQLARAIWHLHTALMCDPKQPAEIHVKLARLYLQRRDRRRARKHLDEALKLDPRNRTARALKSKI